MNNMFILQYFFKLKLLFRKIEFFTNKIAIKSKIVTAAKPKINYFIYSLKGRFNLEFNLTTVTLIFILLYLNKISHDA